MNLSVGIVGLPNVGKSTLFNAFLKRQIAQVAEYPYTTIEPNVGVVEVPDERLDKLAEVISGNPSTHSVNTQGRTEWNRSTTSLRTDQPKVVPAAIKFIDVAGLIKGAHQGEGLGNQFLAHIREVDAILHVVRAFDPTTASGQVIPHVMGDIDPNRDVEIVNLELELGGIKKPAIYVLNVAESDINRDFNLPFAYIKVCAKLEFELADLSDAEQKQYQKALGVEKLGLEQVIGKSYQLLNLITFFTIAGGKMVQAWPVKAGTEMIEVAGIVHSDMERGFIAAEVCDWQKLTEVGSWLAARASGLIKTCGRDEKVVDGLVVEFKFSV